MLRSPHDREIRRLAIPALGALAAEPLYLLVDTAIVGHLGTTQLAALAIAATVLTTLVSLCVFLTYGTTAQVARLHGAGDAARAGELAAQSLWLATAIGVVLALVCAALADPLVALFGGGAETARLAERYLRISALGLPFALIALAGQGYLRGIGDLRTPLVIVVIAQVVNAILEVWFVYGLDLGLDGSALGTVIAQAGMGAAFAWLLLRTPSASSATRSRRPRRALLAPLVRISGELFVRSAALLVAFATASAVIARIGEPSLAAHQIAMGLFVFLALVLDAIAIAAQVLVGRALGRGDAIAARTVGIRAIAWGLVAGCLFGGVLLALARVLPQAFTDDPAVVERARAIWTMLALLQPAAAVVFALDGILIGAGDTRYLAGSMLLAGVCVYVPIALLALALDWGMTGVWAGLLALVGVRLVTLGWRFAGERWAITGAAVARARR
ncbi:MAG: MATE family efflux transporter [Solirubrobacteraceae bacterium]|nr:MATE family efflux transporter [Solirubrobacteraceae bacterium]